MHLYRTKHICMPTMWHCFSNTIVRAINRGPVYKLTSSPSTFVCQLCGPVSETHQLVDYKHIFYASMHKLKEDRRTRTLKASHTSGWGGELKVSLITQSSHKV
mmetsp:Transcript_15380/g.27060  ORF Transcript_15380/g.27060 Transcript_15380/m.27060 type:complete len:103 (-) Transcript_15380:583-891(-)